MRIRRKSLATGLMVAVLSLGVAVPAFAATTATTQSPGWAGSVCRGTGAVADAVAQFLGLTPEAIAAERAAGQSLADIAEQQGKDTGGLVQTILSAKESQIQQAVTDGRLTQEQADTMLKTMTERVTERVADPAMGPRGGNGSSPAGRGRGMGAGMGFGAAGGMGGGTGSGMGFGAGLHQTDAL